MNEGASGTYTAVLNKQPTSDVVVTVIDPTDDTDVTGQPDSLTFTSTDWNIEQTVTVTVAHDTDTADDTATFTHTVASSDEDYDGLSARSVTVTVADDDPQPGPTREGAADLGDITDLGTAILPEYTIDGVDDPVHYFRFTLTEPRQVNLALRQLDYDADLALEDKEGNQFSASTKSGTSTESLRPGASGGGLPHQSGRTRGGRKQLCSQLWSRYPELRRGGGTEGTGGETERPARNHNTPSRAAAGRDGGQRDTDRP